MTDEEKVMAAFQAGNLYSMQGSQVGDMMVDGLVVVTDPETARVAAETPFYFSVKTSEGKFVSLETYLASN